MSQRGVPLLLTVVAAFAAFLVEVTTLAAPFELRLFDRRLALRSATPWPEDVLLVTFDDRLATDVGWPIPKATFIQILDELRAAGARTIAVDFTLDSPADENPELLQAALSGTVLPVFPSRAGDPERLLGLSSALVPVTVSPYAVLPPSRLSLPAPEYAIVASALGHTLFTRGPDDRVRGQIPLLGVEGAGGSLPSFALAALAQQRGLDLSALRFEVGLLRLPGLPPARVYGGEVLLDIRPGEPGPPRIDASALLRGDASARAQVKGALVLLYNGASNMPDVLPTAASPRTPGGVVHAYALRSLAAGHTPRLFPPWLALVILPIGCAYVAPWLARRRAPRVLALGAGTGAAWIAIAVLLVPIADVFLPLTAPLVFLATASVLFSAWTGERSAARLQAAPGSGDAGKAPRGRVAIVFTDVQGSTSLWERAPGAMRDALTVHDDVLREALRAHRGYEVKTDGDAFMIAFRSSADAIAFCLRAQETLFDAPWPAALLEETPLFRGLRVRMGIDVGEPEARPDPLTGRMDYFGSPVNRAARVSSAAHGGQILVTGAVWADVKESLPALGDPAVTELSGLHALRGFEEVEKLVQLEPARFASRQFPALRVERTTRG